MKEKTGIKTGTHKMFNNEKHLFLGYIDSKKDAC